MPFDWQYFAQHGLAPFFGNVGDIMSANMQRQLGREKHQQSMTEMQEQYKLREAEQRRGHEFDTELNKQREKLLEKGDLIERNQMLLRTSHDIWATQKKSQIHMQQTKYEEGLKHKYAIEEDEHRFRLSKDLANLKKNNPDKYTELVFNSIKTSTDALKDLAAMESLFQDKALELTSIIGSEDTRITPEEREKANEYLGRLNQDIKSIGNIKNTLTRQLHDFDKRGATTEGFVPEDRQEYLLKMVEILEDEMGYQGRSLAEIPGNEIITELNRLAMDSGANIEFTPSDLKFLIANIWDEFKGAAQSFQKPPKQKGRR